MTELSTDTLIQAVNRLMVDIGINAESEEPAAVQRLDQCAKALCTQLKAIQDLEAHNLRCQSAEADQKFTRYEDLPPLPVKDRERLERELIDMLSPRSDTGRGATSEPLS